MSDFEYVGSELDLFAGVHNWKAYWSSQIRPFLKGDVLEVGAGIGSNTRLLADATQGRWVCLEPDPKLVATLDKKLAESDNGKAFRNGTPCEAVCGTLQSMPGQMFDTIVYIDVLEHIEHDREELVAAASHLRPGGRVIVLSPAHQRLYAPFDKAIGHFRRYNKSMIRAVSPAGLHLERLRYLDVVGLSASTANSFFLKQSMPTVSQLGVWDRFMIPISRAIDPLIFHAAGKTIIAIWRACDSV